MAGAAGVREATVSLGPMSWNPARSFWAGAAARWGRKRAADLDPGLRPALLALVEPDERGDLMSPLRWTVKSTCVLADEFKAQGHKVPADTVGDLLREVGFSLQGNAKTVEGTQHPDRDAQFCYISAHCEGPVILGSSSCRLGPDPVCLSRTDPQLSYTARR
jgi:hypothetical protein